MPIRLTPAVKVLLIACIAGFVLQQTADQFFGGNWLAGLALVPSGFILKHQLWQLVTYAFLHADVMHLFFNLMMLVFIGGELEAVWGSRRFLKFYFFCSISAGLLYLFLQLLVLRGDGLHQPMVGASGAIFGLLAAYGILFSERTLLFMLVFPMKAKQFVLVLGAIELMSTIFSSRSGLSSAAHLGGMLAGVGYLYGGALFRGLWQQRQDRAGKGRRASKKRSASHLRLVINNPADAPKEFERDDADDDPKTWH